MPSTYGMRAVPLGPSCDLVVAGKAGMDGLWSAGSKKGTLAGKGLMMVDFLQVLFEEKRAVGVELIRHFTKRSVRARREVSGGVRDGVGREFGIRALGSWGLGPGGAGVSTVGVG